MQDVAKFYCSALPKIQLPQLIYVQEHCHIVLKSPLPGTWDNLLIIILDSREHIDLFRYWRSSKNTFLVKIQNVSKTCTSFEMAVTPLFVKKTFQNFV